LSNVAEFAGQFAAPFDLTNEAKLAGFLHDL
jgi:HD superfamily phosphohydrolase YqeK